MNQQEKLRIRAGALIDQHHCTTRDRDALMEEMSQIVLGHLFEAGIERTWPADIEGREELLDDLKNLPWPHSENIAKALKPNSDKYRASLEARQSLDSRLEILFEQIEPRGGSARVAFWGALVDTVTSVGAVRDIAAFLTAKEGIPVSITRDLVNSLPFYTLTASVEDAQIDGGALHAKIPPEMIDAVTE